MQTHEVITDLYSGLKTLQQKNTELIKLIQQRDQTIKEKDQEIERLNALIPTNES